MLHIYGHSILTAILLVVNTLLPRNTMPCVTSPVHTATQVMQALLPRLCKHCYPGYASTATQFMQALLPRLCKHCYPGYASTATQIMQALLPRLCNHCYPGYASTATQVMQALLPQYNWDNFPESRNGTSQALLFTFHLQATNVETDTNRTNLCFGKYLFLNMMYM